MEKKYVVVPRHVFEQWMTDIKKHTGSAKNLFESLVDETGLSVQLAFVSRDTRILCQFVIIDGAQNKYKDFFYWESSKNPFENLRKQVARVLERFAEWPWHPQQQSSLLPQEELEDEDILPALATGNPPRFSMSPDGQILMIPQTRISKILVTPMTKLEEASLQSLENRVSEMVVDNPPKDGSKKHLSEVQDPKSRHTVILMPDSPQPLDYLHGYRPDLTHQVDQINHHLERLETVRQSINKAEADLSSMEKLRLLELISQDKPYRLLQD